LKEYFDVSGQKEWTIGGINSGVIPVKNHIWRGGHPSINSSMIEGEREFK
jgi:hypothetical protein